MDIPVITSDYIAAVPFYAPISSMRNEFGEAVSQTFYIPGSWSYTTIGTGFDIYNLLESPQVDSTVHPSTPNSPAKTAIICGGTYTFACKEIDAGEAGAFVGGIHEYDTVNGNSGGALTEGWIGGEGPLIGGGKITSTQNPTGGYFSFTGVGLSGIFAGIQVGVAGGTGWLGLYVEGHLGPVAVGTGAYLSGSCKKGG